MKTLTSPVRPHKNHPVYAFDVETLGNEREFVCGTFYDEKGAHFTWVKEELKDWLIGAQNCGGIVYATNLFYDYTAVFGGFPVPGRALFTGARLIRIHYPVKGKGTIRFYDTSNLTNRMSVKTLGVMIGLNKGQTPSVLVDNESQRKRVCDLTDSERKVIKEYNIRDAKITYLWALKFQRVCKDLGCEVKTTIASTAMDLYKRQYMDNEFYMPPKWINEYLREAYHGGFVFVFKKGLGENVTYYDIHSLYPYVLAYRDYPDISTMKWEKDNLTQDLIEDYEGFSRCVVHYPDVYFPILPVTIRGHLVTCTGTYSGLWTHVELRAALERGAKILSIKETLYFTGVVTPLKRYMLDLYGRRVQAQDNDDIFQKVFKLFMNALSGKWGQRSDNQLYEPIDIDSLTDPKQLQGITTVYAGNIEYYIKEKLSCYTPDFVNVVWAAYMTAYARLHEIMYLEKAFPDVYACDTDSVFTHYSFKEGKQLGDIGVKDTPRDWVFLYPKQYASWNQSGQWTGRVKGVPRSLQEDYLRNGSITWTKPATFKESIQLGVAPGTWITRKRTDRHKHDKRVFDKEVNPYEDITDSRPFEYSEAIEYFSTKPNASRHYQWGQIPNKT